MQKLAIRNQKNLVIKTLPTVFYLRKCLVEKVKSKLLLCPKCHFLYNFNECLITRRSGMTESLKCSFIQYPNHPHLQRQRKCNAVLLKRVKYGSKSKLIPHKLYVHKSVTSSLQKLLSKLAFVQKCELWRSKPKPSATLFTDIIDGNVWQKFKSVNGQPFLQHPNNFVLET